MNVSGLRLLPALVASSALSFAGGAVAIEPDETRTQTPPTVAAPAVAGGLIAVVDPATGALTEDPELIDRLLADPAIRNALSTSSVGLVEETLPGGGGIRVNLQGRFQSVVVARVDGDGRVRIEHPDASVGAASKTDADPVREGKVSVKGVDRETP